MTEKNQQKIQVKADDKILKGQYSNMMQILHTKEEFVLDFLNIFPPTGTLNSRVILSPGHLKRIAKAIDENLKIYEKKFGEITESEVPDNKIGFQG